jgi:hypothetical protein
MAWKTANRAAAVRKNGESRRDGVENRESRRGGVGKR